MCLEMGGGGVTACIDIVAGETIYGFFLRAVVSCLSQTGSLAHVVCLSGRFSDLGS
jgi:hypothetical protein